ncbi:MAG: hypothetical protein MJA82_20345 [Clostridia bacterium]|nr:hypothetical protein [Clostridia bacterium]
MFKAIRDLMKKPINFNVSIQKVEENVQGQFIEFDKDNTNFKQSIILGKTQSSSEHTKKLMIANKAMNGDSFIVIDSPCGEIEELAKKIRVEYKVSKITKVIKVERQESLENILKNFSKKARKSPELPNYIIGQRLDGSPYSILDYDNKLSD